MLDPNLNVRRYFPLPVILIILLAPGIVTADLLILKNGNVIDSQWVETDHDQVRYEYSGGVVSMPRDRISSIVAGNGTEMPIPAEVADLGQGRAGDRDLSALLRGKLKPRTPIEEATLATVSIDTGVSFGSGFFISDTGYILTNRHVIRGSETADAQVIDKYFEWRQTLERNRAYLDRQSDLLSRARGDFTREWQSYQILAAKTLRQRDRQNLEIRKARLQERERTLHEQESELASRLAEQGRNRQEYLSSYERFNETRRKLRENNTFEIILADETRLYATLHKISRSHDLAILKVSGYHTPRLKTTRAASLPQGNPLYAIGSPIKLKNSVTSGILSGFDGGLIQTSAQIYPGNSGGPLITTEGRVIGINTMKKITHDYEGLGFAIPIETALREFKDQLGEDLR
jgi:serine protease Do